MERTGAMKAFVIAYLVVLAVLAQILLGALYIQQSRRVAGSTAS